MDQLHVLLAWLSVAGALALPGASILTALRRDRSYLLLDRAVLIQLVTMLVATLSGLLLSLGGRLPADPLHFVYAVVGLVTAPGVRYATRRRDATSMARWEAVAGVVVLGALLRLFMTGR